MILWKLFGWMTALLGLMVVAYILVWLVGGIIGSFT